MNIQNHTFLISGGGSGLGKATAQFLSSQGAVVIIADINEAKSLVEDRDSGLGTGGMNSKLEAAMICQKENIETWIVNGGTNGFLVDALQGKTRFTRFGAQAALPPS